MRPVLFLIIFIPCIVFSQNNEITFSEIKRINSKQVFLKLVISKNFTKISSDINEIEYAYNVHEKLGSYNRWLGDFEKSKVAEVWAYYYPNSGEFRFVFSPSRFDDMNQNYEKIKSNIMSQCIYHSIYEGEYTDAVLYTCSSSSYPGKICFYKDTNGGFVIESITNIK